ncbi:MAG: hypothetical protein WKF81_09330 [Thermomicrobiales bacterium]
MTLHNRIVIESGEKRIFASALDWPGWSRSGKSEDEALAVLAEYADRYGVVAEVAGLRGVKATAKDFEIVEWIKGNGATDFGVPDRPAAVELEPMSDAECERQITLLEASWTFFDDVASRVSPELQKGPSGVTHEVSG